MIHDENAIALNDPVAMPDFDSGASSKPNMSAQPEMI
jgi:hypothetical protein